MKKLFILIFLVIFMTSCAPSERAIQTAIAETFAANPTATKTSAITETPTITFTLTSTSTMTPTITQTETITMTPTITNTRTITNTATETLVPYLKTAKAKNFTATALAEYEKVYWKDFITYPYNFENKKIYMNCRVFNVAGYDQIQCYATGTYEAYFVKMKNSFSDIYENNTLGIYGVGGGQECFDNAYGAKICQPLIKNAFYVKN